MSTLIDRPDPTKDQRVEFTDALFGKIFAAAQPGAVFSPPVVSGEYTVITASEVGAGGGFGSGRGTGTKPSKDQAEPGAVGQGEGGGGDGGGGGGGGGGASARPIAVIIVGPDGVKVKPIFDITKVALAGITAWGAMVATIWRMRAKAH